MLVLDNCAAHLPLKSLKKCPTRISVSQPMDMGIIKNRNLYQTGLEVTALVIT
jgi:hypothetical protein